MRLPEHQPSDFPRFERLSLSALHLVRVLGTQLPELYLHHVCDHLVQMGGCPGFVLAQRRGVHRNGFSRVFAGVKNISGACFCGSPRL